MSKRKSKLEKLHASLNAVLDDQDAMDELAIRAIKRADMCGEEEWRRFEGEMQLLQRFTKPMVGRERASGISGSLAPPEYELWQKIASFAVEYARTEKKKPTVRGGTTTEFARKASVRMNLPATEITAETRAMMRSSWCPPQWWQACGRCPDCGASTARLKK